MKEGRFWPRPIVHVASAAVLFIAAAVLRQRLRAIDDIDQLHALSDTVLSAGMGGSLFLLMAYLIGVRFLLSRSRRLTDEDVQRLRARAQTDSLTGLLNKQTAEEAIRGVLEGDGRFGRYALMLIDLDNFKGVNDIFGHQEGDRVLRALAEKIRAVFRATDVVGRFGGDEFVVLMRDFATRDDVMRKAAELQSALEYVTSGADKSVTVTGSIGISLYTGDGKCYETLLREADEALYRAKLAGKSRYYVYGAGEAAGARGGEPPALADRGASIQLKALIDNIDGGIALLEVDSSIRAIYLSSSYVRQMNLSYDGIKRADNRVLDFIHEEDAPQVEEKLRRGAVSWKPVEAVFRRRTESGRIKWYHMRAVRILLDSSEKPVMIAIVTDVTNLKETELNYQAQKKQLETVLKVSRVVTFEVDIAARTLHVTDPTVVKYGIDTNVIENMPDSLIEGGAIHPDSVDECRRMYDEIYAGVPEGQAIIRTMKRDGQYTLERFTYFTVSDEAGRPVKAVGVAEGIEAQSEKELSIELIEKQLRHQSEELLECLKVRVQEDEVEFIKREMPPEEYDDGRYSSVLRYWQQLADGEEESRKVLETFGAEALLRSASAGAATASCEYRLRGGKWRMLVAGLQKSRMDGKLYAFVHVRDATRKREIERELGVEARRCKSPTVYALESLRDIADRLTAGLPEGKPCAVAVLEVANYGEIREMYGALLMKKLETGFVGKTVLTLRTEELVHYDGRGEITVLFPEFESEEVLEARLEKTVKFLKNPAYFQFHEEVALEFRFGLALAAGPDDCFEAMRGRARAAAGRSLGASGYGASDGVANK